MNNGELTREDLSALFVVSRRIGFCLGAIVAFESLNDYLKRENDVADVELIRADDDRCVMGSIIALRRVKAYFAERQAHYAKAAEDQCASFIDQLISAGLIPADERDIAHTLFVQSMAEQVKP